MCIVSNGAGVKHAALTALQAVVPGESSAGELCPLLGQLGRQTKKRGTVIRYREPTVEDGSACWRLARDSGNLDLNSPYTYLMLCRYFADTCVIAEEDNEPLGFILGYRMPQRPESVFVWQVTSSPAARGRGLATSMMAELLLRHARQGGSFLEATVTPSNTASQRLFRGVARKLGVPCEESLEFPRELFPGDEHEEEVLFRIGPFCADSVRKAFATEAAATAI